MKPMKIEEIMDQEVQNLSGGELQRVALVLCLGKPADVYLIDEPSAYLDSEQRLVAAKVIKRLIKPLNPSIYLLLIVKFFLDLFCMLKRRDSWWSTISSWLHI